RAGIGTAFEWSNGTYGHRRVHAQLRRWDVRARPELVRRLMRLMGLVPCQARPRRRGLTRPGATVVPDLVGRDFTAPAPGQKLVGDITYIPTMEGWLYLATVIDCCTKEVIGYAMGDHYRTPLITRAIRNAARNRKLADQAIFHSDRGSNYLSDEYASVLAELGLRRSAGQSGSCFDNAMAESFFGVLKNELVSPHHLSHQGSGTAGHHPVHRILVQSATASLGTGLPTSTRSSRRTRKSSHRRLTIPDLMPLSGKREAPHPSPRPSPVMVWTPEQPGIFLHRAA